MRTSGDGEEAGASADEQADVLADLADHTLLQIQTLQAALAQIRTLEHSFRKGAEGERALAAQARQVLVDLGSTDWHLLPDRHWPGTRRANLDLVLVGPPGVFVLDAKNWRDARIERDTLWRGQADVTDELDKARAQADALSDTLAGINLAAVAVQPMLVLVGQRVPPVQVAGVTVLGERSLQRELVRCGSRLDSDQISHIVDYLDEHCPPASTAHRQRRVPPPAPATPESETTQLSFVDTEGLFRAASEAASRGGIEQWMTWLKPEQSPVVMRQFSGPARIRGAAGTGKTVIALHRARHLARQPGARVLFTSFVRTLPRVYEGLFARMAPNEASSVEFRSLHSWAMRLLASRGRELDVTAWTAIFDEVWADVGRTSELARINVPATYWRDEITSVIKARGISRMERYLALTRVGRRTPLREEQRRVVWRLFEEYQSRLEEARASDWEDVLLMALTEVQSTPVSTSYTSVIVDEVQDLDCVGLQLLHRLVGDRPNGLLLVGDGQQSVYPGGFTLSEAGVSVSGRSVVLSSNYRNGSRIMRQALDHIAADNFSDLEEGDETGARAVEVEREGGVVREENFESDEQQSARLLEVLRWTAAHGTPLGDIAILVETNPRSAYWVRVLQRAGLATCTLYEYDGRPVDAVKVGTYQRAKGLEFSCVFLPDFRARDGIQPEMADSDNRDEIELAHRQQFVAMTRARDRLWIGRVTPWSGGAGTL